MLDVFPLPRGPLRGTGTVGGWYETSLFGGRIDPLTGRPGTHGGEDLAYSGCQGKPMYAVKPGRLFQSIDGSLATAGGRWSRLVGDDGITYGYGHASRYEAAPGVDPLNGGSRRVNAGDVIAYVGSTGGSNGAHLHFQVTVNGRNVDPYDLLHEAANRFAGEPAPIIPAPNPEDDDMPKQYAFPEGPAYMLVPALTVETKTESGWTPIVNDATFAWQYITGTISATGAVKAEALSSTVVKLAAGDDAADALFGQFPVLNGPHKRGTHT